MKDMTLPQNLFAPGNPSGPVWLAMMIISALTVGLAAGFAAWAGGDDPSAAVLTGGGAFIGAPTTGWLFSVARLRVQLTYLLWASSGRHPEVDRHKPTERQLNDAACTDDRDSL